VSGIAWTVQHTYQGSDFFRQKLDAAGVDARTIRSAEDLPRLPLSDRRDLRDAYPFGWTCVPMAEVVRVHASAGTAGSRVLATYTARDLEDWAEMSVRCYEYAGVTHNDRVQVTEGFGLSTAGTGFSAGAERLGATVVPTGPESLDLQFEMMLELQGTVVCATPSFGLLMAEEAHARSLVDRLSLRVGLLGSERWRPSMRRRIEELLGIETFDVYGFTELYGPGTGIDCTEHQGIHYWDDFYALEVVDPQSGEVLPPGAEGELVVTTLRKEAQPLLRYRTHDLSRLIPGPCTCGSPYPRIDTIKGRSDDMFEVRGVMIYPAQIDTILSGLNWLSGEYEVHLGRHQGREALLVRVESSESERRDDVAEALHEGLGVGAEVEIVAPGTLPRTERKTGRVFDDRE
jgi:phenylacetate-CoA ligase